MEFERHSVSTGRAECGTWEKFPLMHWHTVISPAPACPIPPSPTVPRVSAQIPAATVFLARSRATPFYRPISAAVDGVGVATEPETHPAMFCSFLPKESRSQEINESVRWIVPARRRHHGPIYPALSSVQYTRTMLLRIHMHEGKAFRQTLGVAH